MEDFLNAWVEITEAMKELWLFGRPLATDVACCNYAKLKARLVIIIKINLHTKFDTPRFICSKDVAWARKFRNGSHDHDHAHLGDI